MPKNIITRLVSSFPFLNKGEWQLVWILFIVSVLSRSMILFNLGYQTDDYAASLIDDNRGISINWFIQEGRFFAGLVYIGLGKIGLINYYSSGLLFILASFILVWSGAILCRIWNIENDRISSGIVMGFLSLHPYLTELFSYHSTYPMIAFEFGLGFLGLWFMLCGSWIWLIGCFCIVAALGTYQVIVHYLSVAVLFGVALQILRFDWSQGGLPMRSLGFRRIFRAVFGLPFAVFLYFIIQKTIQYTAGIACAERGDFLHGYQTMTRLRDIKHFLEWIMYRDELLPTSTRLLLLLLLICGFAALLKKFLLNKKYNKNIIFIIFSAMVVIFAAAISSLSLPIFLSKFQVDPRIISAMALWWAGIACIALLSQGWLRIATICESVAILMGFFSVNTRLLSEQIRLNRWDFSLANRIIYRLEELPEFKNVKRIIVLGGNTDYQQKLGIRHGEIGASAFGRDWSKRLILCEASGYQFEQPTTEDFKLALELFQISPKWPSDGSVQIKGELGLIFLPPPKLGIFGNEIPMPGMMQPPFF